MQNRQLSLVPSSTYRALIFFSASPFISVHEIAHQRLRIEDELLITPVDPYYVDRKFAEIQYKDMENDPDIRAIYERAWTRLLSGNYGHIWFYGDCTSENIREVAVHAFRKKLSIRCFSPNDSLLSRYINRWYHREFASWP
jgi:hypothetical protein